MDQMDFGSFLERNQKYKKVFDGLSERFNLFFVTALDYCHQIDLHLNQGPSNLLDEKKQQLFSCMEDILSRIEEPYAAEVQAAFDEFKEKHGNDEPVHGPLEFQQILESFLEFLEKKINPPPPQEQQDRFSFPWFLRERFSGLVSAIEEDQRLTIMDKRALSFFILGVLSRDSVGPSLDLTNRGFFGPQGIQNPAVSQYMDALRGAYALYAYRGTYPDEFLMMSEKSADR
jgi:hypothetical protein